MTAETKFTLVRSETEQHGRVCVFGRGSDGMVIGVCQEDTVHFGENPTGEDKIVRVFVDHNSAVEWAKQKCREYAGREDVDFVERSVERKILMPRGPQSRTTPK